MKKLIISAAMLSLCMSLSAETYRNKTSGMNVYNWSDPSMWLISSTGEATTKAPGATDTVNVWYNSNTLANPFEIFVDEDVTIKNIVSNSTASSTAFNLSQYMTSTATSLTIDTAATGNAYAVVLNAAINATSQNSLLAFEGVAGSKLILTNSVDSSGYLQFGMEGNQSVDSKTIRFGENVAVESHNNLRLYGGSSGTLPVGYFYEIDGSVTVKKDSVYKELVIDGSAGGVNVIVGKTGSIDANTISFGTSNAKFVLNGTATLHNNAKYTFSKGSMEINGNLNIGENVFEFTGGNLTVGGKNAITASEINIMASAAGSVFTVSKDAEFTATRITSNANQRIIVEGKLDAGISGSMRNYTVSKGGTLNFTNLATWTIFAGDWIVDGKVTTTGFTGDSKLASGKMTVNEGAVFVHNVGTLMFDGFQSVYGDIGPKSELILNGSNVFRSTETGSQSDFKFSFYRGKIRIEVNADNQFKTFDFTNQTGDQQTILTLAFAETVLLELENLYHFTTSDSSLLVLEDFGLGKFKLKNYSSIDTSKISSTDKVGGELKWSNFRFDTNGFLVADMIPEPSTYAAIFGALAIAFAAYRRRK